MMIEALEARIMFSGTQLEDGLLTITGTNRRDVIEVASNADGSTSVRLNKSNFTFDNVEAVMVNARGGNDDIDFSKLSTIPTRIEGGRGNDFIIGSDANDVIVDRFGTNWIFAGGGDDFIIITGKRDLVEGNDGDDYVGYSTINPSPFLWGTCENSSQIDRSSNIG